MRQSIRLGRIAGIPIGAHWSVVVIAALLGYSLAISVLPAGAPGQSTFAYVVAGVAVAVLFLAGLLGHELAHALVAQRYGIGVRRITLWLLGGVSELDREAPTPRSEFLIAVAGPLASVAVAAVAAGGGGLSLASGASRLLVVGFAWLAWVNVFLAVFNLLPGAPLDGGRVVRAVVWRLRGDRDRAQIASDRAGVALGVLMAAAGVVEILFLRNFGGIWLILLGWFLIGVARAESAGTRLNQALHGRKVRDIMATEPVHGVADQTVDAFVTGTAAQHPHDTYPVVDAEGRLVGMVRLEDLARIPESGRSGVPLHSAAAPISSVPTIAPEDPAADAARNLSPAHPLLPVADHDRLVGVVAASDVANAIQLGRFGRTDRDG